MLPTRMLAEREVLLWVEEVEVERLKRKERGRGRWKEGEEEEEERTNIGEKHVLFVHLTSPISRIRLMMVETRGTERGTDERSPRR